MKEIPLTQGRVTVVDDEDYPLLSRFRWHVGMEGKKRDRPYARGTVFGRSVRMQRFVLNAPEGLVVDHINGDTLDNRKQNLRVCTNGENIRNSKARKEGGSAYKGVRQIKKEPRVWSAMFKQKGLGKFLDEKAAAMAYDTAARKKWGEYAWLNFPDEEDEEFVNSYRWHAPTWSKHKFYGVNLHARTGRWHAVALGISFGYYDTKEEAARAHDGAQRMLRGDNGKFNFPDEHANVGLPEPRIEKVPDVRPLREYSAKEAAALLNYSEAGISLLIKRKELKAHRKQRHGLRYFIPGSEIARFAEDFIGKHEGRFRDALKKADDPLVYRSPAQKRQSKETHSAKVIPRCSEQAEEAVTRGTGARVGERVKAFRRFKGWSLRTMAESAGVSHALISQIECGRIIVTAKTAKKLAPVMRLRWTTLCD